MSTGATSRRVCNRQVTSQEVTEPAVFTPFAAYCGEGARRLNDASLWQIAAILSIILKQLTTPRSWRYETTMNKTVVLILVFCAVALSACAASKPVPGGLMMSAPGENGAYTDLGN